MQYSLAAHVTAMAVSFIALEALLYAACLATVRLPVENSSMRLVVAYSRWDSKFRVHAFFVWQLCAWGTYLLIFRNA